MNRLSQYFTEFWQGQRCGLQERLLLILLLLPSYMYGSVMRLRSWCYSNGLCTVRQLPRPVISVGNLTVGGTGKTPVTAWIARRLIEQGLKVAVLSRGYGGALEGRPALVSDGQNILLPPDQCGDEPYLLAITIPGLIVMVGSDRYRAGQLVMECLTPDVFLLDDGFQHLRLHRDLNILLMDCRRPMGNGRVLPAGSLREQAQAILRADLLIYTRCNQGPYPEILPDLLPCCRSSHQIASFYRLSNGVEAPVEQLQDKKVVAFAGIADPRAFFEGLRQRGIKLSATLALADHETYGSVTIAKLEHFVREVEDAVLLTTEKDGVKLQQLRLDWLCRVVTARLELVFDDEAPLGQAVAAAAFKAT